MVDQQLCAWYEVFDFNIFSSHREVCIVGCRGASQLGGSLVGIPLGYMKDNFRYRMQQFYRQFSKQ